MLSHEMLAIDPAVYRRWADQIRQYGSLAEIFGRLQSPEAAARMRPARQSIGDIAVIPIGGFISQKASIWTEIFGGTSTEQLVGMVRAAIAEPSVGAIVLNVDSPGGSVFGLAEASAALRALRGTKPIVSVANPIMASAAYYLASQADEIVATPSALVGSIGTIAVVTDPTDLYEKMGVKFEVFTYGERKDEAMPPLDDEGRAAIQNQVDYYGAMFEADVAAGRGISRRTVRARYGQGAVFNAEEALSVGLADRIGTLEEAVGALASGRKPKPRLAASNAGRVQVAAWRLRLGLTGFDRGVD